MSLLDEFKSACLILDKKRVPDGEGGFKTTWAEGAKFMAAIVLNTSIEARIGEKQGLSSLYTVTTGKNALLQYHDVFRRLYDNKTFRVTSDGDDKISPPSATIDATIVTAEEWSLPT